MAAEDLERAISALDDESVRARVADGEIEALGDIDLTDEERELVIGAASEAPEVIGHAIRTGLLGLDGPGGPSTPGQAANTVNKAKTADKAHQAMTNYLKG